MTLDEECIEKVE
jgi:hypothetical protein